MVQPAAAFLVTALATTPYNQAIGAYLISAAAFVVLGLSGWFDRLIRLIPVGVAAGLLAGILLQFGTRAFAGLAATPSRCSAALVLMVCITSVTR